MPYVILHLANPHRKDMCTLLDAIERTPLSFSKICLTGPSADACALYETYFCSSTP